MATCRFHGHKGAKTYCPRCQLFLCESCGKPGQGCKLCNQARLVDAQRAPEQARRLRTCTIHPSIVQGLKTCQGCEQLHCPSCMKFGGLCVTCTRHEQEARAGLPKLANPTEEALAPKRGRPRDPSGTQKFRKGRKRAFVRGAIACAGIALLGGLLVLDYHNLVKLTQLGSKHSRQVQAALHQGDGRPGYDELVGRLERGETTDADLAETEALMDKLTNGQEIDSPGKLLADRLSALKRRSGEGLDPRAKPSEQSQKMWGRV